MTEALETATRLFHDLGGLDPAIAARHIATATDGADDGELFLEYRESESISLEDGRIRAANFDTRRGFGLRAVLGEASYYAHAGELSDGALARAASTIASARAAEHAMVAGAPAAARRRYTPASTRWRKCPSPPAPPCSPRSTPSPAPPTAA